MIIYVNNLSFETTDESLRQVFLPFGSVNQVMIVRDEYTGGQNLGRYGYVEMPIKSEGTAAILHLNGTIFGGRLISTIEGLPVSNKSWKKQSRIRPPVIGGPDNV